MLVVMKRRRRPMAVFLHRILSRRTTIPKRFNMPLSNDISSYSFSIFIFFFSYLTSSFAIFTLDLIRHALYSQSADQLLVRVCRTREAFHPPLKGSSNKVGNTRKRAGCQKNVLENDACTHTDKS